MKHNAIFCVSMLFAIIKTDGHEIEVFYVSDNICTNTENIVIERVICVDKIQNILKTIFIIRNRLPRP